MKLLIFICTSFLLGLSIFKNFIETSFPRGVNLERITAPRRRMFFWKDKSSAKKLIFFVLQGPRNPPHRPPKNGNGCLLNTNNNFLHSQYARFSYFLPYKFARASCLQQKYSRNPINFSHVEYFILLSILNFLVLLNWIISI